MATIELTIPAMGEGVTDAVITKWLKQPGDAITENETIVEIATDKVDSEIPSPVTGFIEKIFVSEGSVAEVGKVIALISTEQSTIQPKITENKKQTIEKFSENIVQHFENIEKLTPKISDHIPHITPSGKFLSPFIRTLAAKENINIEELDTIQGSGLGSRITKEDLLHYIEQKKKILHQNTITNYEVKIPPTELPKNIKPTVTSFGDNVELIEMSRMRKLIADHMLKSMNTSPHVTSFTEADVTNIIEWRNKVKESFKTKYNEKLTLTPIFIYAVVKALKDYPMINVSVDGYTIIKKNNINIGVATALPDGNLIVPVIKNADKKNITELAIDLNDLVLRARENKLLPEEIKGGTFSITNIGTYKNLMGTPIINQPEVAILGLGLIKKRPVVIETLQGDSIGIRQMIYFSLSYDHRVIDGALSGLFLDRLASYIQNFDVNQQI